MHYIVVEEKNKNKDNGFGYNGPVLRELGFPQGPYGLAGAKTLVRQAKTVNPKLSLVILPYEGTGY